MNQTDPTAAIYDALAGLQGGPHHLPPGTRQAIAEHLAATLPAVPAVVSPPTDRAELRKAVAHAIHRYDNHHALSGNDVPSEHHYGEADAVLAVLGEPTDRAAEELAKCVTRAIWALKSPPPPGSQHYRSGWDDGLEAAIDAARDEVLRRLAGEAHDTGTQQPEAVAPCTCQDNPSLTAQIGYPVRCPHCPPGTAAVPPTHWTKHVQRHHPEAAPMAQQPAAEAPGDTLPAWLLQRFDPRSPDWDALSDDDRAYWEHQAAAVRRAVARGGFKAAPAVQQAAAADDEETP